MGTVIREITLDTSADIAWPAVADVGNVHTRLVPGMVRDCILADGVRTVTFANGVVLREVIVTIDPQSRRIAYGSIGGKASHHSASIQIVPTGASSCRLIWTTDALPDEVIGYIRGNVEAALPIMKATIETMARDQTSSPEGRSASV